MADSSTDKSWHTTFGRKKTILAGIVITVIAVCVVYAFIPDSIAHIDATAINTVRLYSQQGRHTLSSDYLSQMPCSELDRSVVQSMVQTAKYRRRKPHWKNAYIAELELNDGRTVQASISYHGGFFEIHGQPGVYYVPRQHADTWTRLIRSTGGALYDEYLSSLGAETEPTTKPSAAP